MAHFQHTDSVMLRSAARRSHSMAADYGRPDPMPEPEAPRAAAE